MLLAVFLTATFLFSSCENQNCDCEETETPVLSAPGNIIPVAAADTLYKNYGNSRVSLIELAENVTNEGDTIVEGDSRYKKATRYVSFSFSKMQKYMAYIEQQADSADVDVLELRVYFGKYGDNVKKKDEKNKGTVFFNPAAALELADGTIDTVSYAIVNTGAGFKAVPVGTILNNELLGGEVINAEDIESMSGNIGHSAPPPPVSSGDF